MFKRKKPQDTDALADEIVGLALSEQNRRVACEIRFLAELIRESPNIDTVDRVLQFMDLAAETIERGQSEVAHG